GLHTGAVEDHGPEVRGFALHMGARIMPAAGPGEILVSNAVRELMAGSDVRFEDRGLRKLKGVPAQWHLFAATTLPKDVSAEPSSLPSEPAAGRRLPPRWLVTVIVALAIAGTAALSLTRGWESSAGHPPAQGGRTTGSPGVAAPDNAALQIDPASGRVRTTVTGLRAGERDAPARHVEGREGGGWIDRAI